jgi:hypothetical protein
MRTRAENIWTAVLVLASINTGAVAASIYYKKNVPMGRPGDTCWAVKQVINSDNTEGPSYSQAGEYTIDEHGKATCTFYVRESHSTHTPKKIKVRK